MSDIILNTVATPTQIVLSGGLRGEPGPTGAGVPAGGDVDQVLAKSSGTDYDTEWVDIPSAPVSSVNGETGAVVLTTADIADSSDKRYVTDAQLTVIGNTSGTNSGDQDLSGYVPTTRTVNGQALSSNVTLTKSDVGLGNVDNTSDTGKPISTATQTALDLKAPLASPALTGTPTVPTATTGTNTTQAASTAFVQQEITAGATPDATTLVKGKVQLAGDLGGTAASPTTPTAVHLAGTETVTGDKTFSGSTTLGNTTFTDATNIVLNTTTGTKIGTATTQKLGFFNATPVAQQTATSDPATALSNLGLRAVGTAYPLTTTGLVTFNGGYRQAATTRTGAVTLSAGSPEFNYLDATTAGFTVTLPAVSGLTGQKFTFIKIDATANVIVVDGNGSETINGLASVSFNTQYQAISIHCSGTTWYIY